MTGNIWSARYTGLLMIIAAVLYLTSRYSYLLFHTLVELTTIAIGFTLFILAWNTRRFHSNNYLNLLGISYAFIALVDLIHALAYKGMSVFPGHDANLPTQLWIAARYLQALTLCSAPLFMERRVDNRIIFAGYAGSVALIIYLAFSGNFPDCFIEGTGLTPFKIGSEYVISALLLLSLELLYRIRQKFDQRIFRLLVSSIVCTALSEILFTVYLSVYGFANMAGHILKLAAFYLIYRALLVTGLKAPFDLIFRGINQNDETFRSALNALEKQVAEKTPAQDVRKSVEYTRSLIEASLDPLVTIGADGRITDVNAATEAITGYPREELIGTDFSNYFTEPEKARSGYRHVFQEGLVRDYPLEIRHRDGEVRSVLYNASVYRDEHGQTAGVFAAARDITERKEAEESLRRLNRELRAISNCNQVLMRAEDEQSLLGDICRIVCDEAGYRMAWVGYAENDKDRTIRPVAWAGAEMGYLHHARLTWADTERGRGPSGIAIRSGKPDYIQDFTLESKAAPWRENALQRGYRSMISLPLKDEDAKTFGILNIYSSEPHAFNPDEVRLLEELAGDLAFGITVLRSRIERERTAGENRKLAAIVESSNDAIIAKDLNGIILSWNRGAERIYGYSAPEVIGRSIAILLPPDHPDELVEILDRLKSGERIKHYTTERIHKDGQRIFISLTVSPIRDGSGTIVGASSIAHDDTLRKQAEEALRSSETRLKEAQRLARIGNWELDLENNRLLWSDEIYRIFEIDPARFGASYEAFLEAIHPDDRDAVNAAYTDSVAKRTPYTIEHRLLFADGRVKHVHEQCETHYAVDGRPRRSIGTVQDITERVRAEEAIRELNAGLEKRVEERTLELKKSQHALMNIVDDLNEKTEELEQANLRLQELERLKSMFIASMSHELRTPLNSIIGFSSILHDEWLGPVNEGQKENLAIILRSGKHLLSLINDVIDVSKIEAGKIEVLIQEFDLFELIMEAVAYVAKDIRDKGLDLKIDIIHLTVATDRQRLLQCVLNLLSNAMKFTEKGEVSINARSVPPSGAATEESVVEISVTDSGIGIRQEDLPRMFSPFVRLVSPGQATIPGTGLGLYLTRKLTAEILRGDIQLSSEFGTGSCFTIRIPARIS